MGHPRVPMAEVELQRMLLRWILIPVGALALLSGVWLWEISRLLATAHWVDHADRVISQAQKVETRLIEREAALRGFLLSGKAEFLEPYKDADKQLDGDLAKLASLVHEEPGAQEARAAEIVGERAAWDVLAREALIGFDGTGALQAKALTLDTAAAASMHRLRDSMRNFIRAEEALRNERSRSHQHAAKLVVASSAALALMLGVVLAFAARRSLWGLSEAYRRALGRAEDAVHVRDEFMSIAAHELRTPITALNLHLEGLARAPGLETSGPVGRKVDAARRQTRRLSSLVDNLLDVSRLTGGPPVLVREDVDLAEIIHTVVDRFRDAGAAVTCTIDREGAIPGRLDRLRIEQLLTNLLSNAVKFGESKPIEVRLEAHAGFAMLRVHDEGIGIAEDAQERIFNRFERAVPTRAYNGLGLGLFLARQVVEAHGGSIGVESRPGAGTTFTVLLPLGPPEEWRSPSAEPAAQTLH